MSPGGRSPWGEKPSRPEPPLTLTEAQARPEWELAIEAGLSLLRSK